MSVFQTGMTLRTGKIVLCDSTKLRTSPPNRENNNDISALAEGLLKSNAKLIDDRSTPRKKLLLLSDNDQCSPSKKMKENSPRQPRTPTFKKSPEKKQKENLESPSKKKIGSLSRRSRRSPVESKSDKDKEEITKANRVSVALFRNDVSAYQDVKRALALSTICDLRGRESEMRTISNFLEKHLMAHNPGSIYISGGPGTGKTACINAILTAVKFMSAGFKIGMINCTNLKTANSIFERIWKEISAKGDDCRKKTILDYQKSITRALTKTKHMTLLVLDEIDYLEEKSHDVLYSIFEWPAIEDSKLVLIGIANALDLTARVLPRLQTHAKYRPQLLHFPPYTKDQVIDILNERLKQVSKEAQTVIKPVALQFCARKVSSVSGDVRKALDVCRRAVEVIEADVRRQQILKPRAFGENGKPGSSDEIKVTKCVELPLIVSIFNDVYGNSLANRNTSDENALPLQQKLLLCALLLIVKQEKLKEVTLGKFHEIYSRICKKQQLTLADQAEFISLCTLIETRGLITMKRNKDIRMSKVTLRIDESEVEHALQDRCLLMSILNDESYLSKK